MKFNLKIVITNYFLGKKKAKIPQQKSSPAVVPVAANEQQIPPQIPTNINWDDHADTRDLINQRVPGGVEAVNALVKLLQENQAAQKN